MKSKCFWFFAFLPMYLVNSAVNANEPARVAWLGTGTSTGSAEFVKAFKDGLRENGLVEGRHYVFDARYADNHYERFPELVADLLTRNPSVIMVVTVSSVRAAKNATTRVPIVMISTTDPVRSGLVKTLAKPGGNVTGYGNMAEDLSEKYVQLLKDLKPAGRRLGVLIDPKNPSSEPVYRRINAAAQKRAITVVRFDVKGQADLKTAFAAMDRERIDGLALIANNAYLDRRVEICGLAARHRIAVLAFAPDFADAGCAIGFGSPRKGIFRRSATYVRKIIDGADPANLPVELPTIFELVVNKQTLGAFGVAIPPVLLQRADRFIE